MEELTYDGFISAINLIAKRIKDLDIKTIYGVPRGGRGIELYLSHKTEIPVVEKEDIDEHTLIVDDLADTGKTLLKYKLLGCKIATIYYHKQSKVIPDVWIYEKKKDWILFPWETEKSTR